MKGDKRSFPAPQLEPPHGQLPSAIEYDIAFFFGKAALLMQTDFHGFLNKLRVYLRFLRLRKKQKSLPSSPLEEKAKSCLIIHAAPPSELEFHLLSLLSERKEKEFILPVLKEAILVARNDRRFYLLDKNVIEKLLLETAVFDEALEDTQRHLLRESIGYFANIYVDLLDALFAWGMEQTNPSLIHSTLLCASGLKNVYETLPQADQESLSFFLRSLSGCIASLNMLQEEYFSKTDASITPQAPKSEIFSAQETLYQLHTILFFAIRSLPLLSPLEELLIPFLQKTPSIQALFLISSLPYEDHIDASFLMKAAIWAGMLSLLSPFFITLYVLQQRQVQKEACFSFLQSSTLLSPSLLIGFCEVWKHAFQGSEQGAFLALLTIVSYAAMMKCMLRSPSSLPQNPLFWKKKQLSFSAFCNKLFGPLNLPPLSSLSSFFEQWNPKEFPTAPSIAMSCEETDILMVFQKLSFSFFWPELDSLVKKMMRGVHIKKLTNQTTLDTLIETADLLLKAASSETLELSFLQLVSESAKQVRAVHTFLRTNVERT